MYIVRKYFYCAYKIYSKKMEYLFSIKLLYLISVRIIVYLMLCLLIYNIINLNLFLTNWNVCYILIHMYSIIHMYVYLHFLYMLLYFKFICLRQSKDLVQRIFTYLSYCCICIAGSTVTF